MPKKKNNNCEESKSATRILLMYREVWGLFLFTVPAARFDEHESACQVRVRNVLPARALSLAPHFHILYYSYIIAALVKSITRYFLTK